MMGRHFGRCCLVLALFAVSPGPPAFALGTAFTYQGQLQQGGAPTNGSCDFQFSLWDELGSGAPPAGGDQIGSTQTKSSVNVDNGVFTVPLDFGAAAFSSASDRWLHIAVRCPAGSGSYQALAPRQPLTPAPFALFADAIADGSVSSGKLALGAVTTPQLANESVTAAKIADGNIAANDLANGAVTTAKIADGAVTSAKIANNTIADSDIDATKVQRRVTGTCAAANALSQVNIDGTVACVAVGDITAVTAGTGLNGGGTNGNVTLAVAVPLALSGNIDGDVLTVTNSNAVDKQANAVHGITVTGVGVWGESAGVESAGVFGQSTVGVGVLASSQTSTAMLAHGSLGIVGRGTASGSAGDGVRGEGLGSNGNGVHGIANNGGAAYGVYGESTSGYAGYFTGKVNVTGTLTKGSGSFKIDHPLDPANKYLSHSFVESPDMKNIYDGITILDDDGQAEIELPNWFQALNRDFRYQLTCVGAFAPVYVAEELHDNRFRIAGGSPHQKISWQVTGIRQDAFANGHRIAVEENKPAEEVGTYLHPVELGMPASSAVDKLKD